MNNDMNDSELESLLRGLSPAKASPALMRRVDEELQLDMSWLGSTTQRPARRAPRWISSVSWAAMGAAAAVTVMSWLPQAAQSTATLASAQPAPAVMPVSTSTANLREWNEEDNQRYNRRQAQDKHFIVVSREMQTWGDPRYGAQTNVEISSKNKLLVPVTFH